jgi:hypothetical protein
VNLPWASISPYSIFNIFMPLFEDTKYVIFLYNSIFDSLDIINANDILPKTYHECSIIPYMEYNLDFIR